MSIKTIVAVAPLVMPLAAQEQGRSSTCTVHYENHNQIDYGPLVVQDVKGTITDPQQVAVPKVCAGVFTEKDHKLVATTESDGGLAHPFAQSQPSAATDARSGCSSVTSNLEDSS
jgi:hypothetical protein